QFDKQGRLPCIIVREKSKYPKIRGLSGIVVHKVEVRTTFQRITVVLNQAKEILVTVANFACLLYEQIANWPAGNYLDVKTAPITIEIKLHQVVGNNPCIKFRLPHKPHQGNIVRYLLFDSGKVNFSNRILLSNKLEGQIFDK